MSRKLIDPALLLEDLGEEPYIWTDTDAEIQEHSDWLRFKEMIERQPTVDAVEVVHGRWSEEIADYRICSVCGYEHCTDDRNGFSNADNYCPNCGAKMDGDGNG